MLIETREQLLNAARAAVPGSRLRLAGGSIRGNLFITNLIGRPEAPIVIEAADPDHPPVIEDGNGIHLVGPRHVHLRGLHIQGATSNGLNIDDGGDPNRPARNLRIEGLVIRDIGPRGNRDGIKLSGVRDFLIRGCRFEGWGDAGSAIDMVGCHAGRIERCRFHNPNGRDSNAVQTKGGSSAITIAQSLFRPCGARAINMGGFTGLDYFRPRDATAEARDITVEDCTFRGSHTPVAFVGVDGAVVRHCTIDKPESWVLRILQENTAERFVPCRNGVFEHNVVAFMSGSLRQFVNVGSGTQAESFRFASNLWFCINKPRQTREFVRLPAPDIDPLYGINPNFTEVDGQLWATGQAADAGVGSRPQAFADDEPTLPE